MVPLRRFLDRIGAVLVGTAALLGSTFFSIPARAGFLDEADGRAEPDDRRQQRVAVSGGAARDDPRRHA